MRLSSRMFSSVSARSFFVAGIIAIAVVAFAITGVAGQFKGVDANVAAEVGSQRVSIYLFNNRVMQLNQQYGDKIDKNRLRSNVQTVLNELVYEKIFLEEATRMGWNARDVELAASIRKHPAFINKQTAQFDLNLYKKYLANGQTSELELFQETRDRLTEQKISSLLAMPLPISKTILKEELARNNTEFELEYLELQPSQSSIKSKALEDAKKFVADANNEKQLQAEYDADKSQYVRKAQYKVKTLLIGFDKAERASGEAKKRTEADAEKLASLHLTSIQDDAVFAKLSSQLNDDERARANGGILDNVDDAAIDPASFEAIKSLSVGKPVSGVIKTAFGYRIFRLIEARPAVEKSLEMVKNELAERIVTRDLKSKAIDELNAEVNAILGGNDVAKLNDVSVRNGLLWKKLKNPYTVSTRFIEELGVGDPLAAVVFKLKKPGDITSAVLNIGGKSVVLRLISRVQKPLPDADKKLKELEKQQSNAFMQAFYSSAQRKLYEVYTKENKIDYNPAIFSNIQ